MSIERKQFGERMAHVVAVHRSPAHTCSEQTTDSVELIAGLGVRGDAHMGAQVKHRSRVRMDPTQPNLRQVHLIASETPDEANEAGFDVAPGDPMPMEKVQDLMTRCS